MISGVLSGPRIFMILSLSYSSSHGFYCVGLGQGRPDWARLGSENCRDVEVLDWSSLDKPLLIFPLLKPTKGK